MITIKDISAEIEKFAPIAYQQSYDNCGLNVGDSKSEAKGALLCFDVTEKIIDEAIENGCNIVISHHPVIFGGLKKINYASETEHIIIKAIKNDIALYCAHTNLDSVKDGINTALAKKLGLQNITTLTPSKGLLVKLTVFVPTQHAQKLRLAMFDADAGKIANYDCCSYNTEGYGTFRANENANPFVGNVNQQHTEPETMVQVIVKRQNINAVIKAMVSAHPYEEPAYDLIPLENKMNDVGHGALGELPETMNLNDFLQTVKNVCKVQLLKTSEPHINKIKKVALFGGSGTEFMKDAIAAKADVYITGDCKYHQFADAANNIILIDAGHFETECFAVEIFYDIITKKFPNFAVRISDNISNPVKYY